MGNCAAIQTACGECAAKICCQRGAKIAPEEADVEDDDAKELSDIGRAAYDALRTKESFRHHQLWNVTSGTVVGEAHQTPKDCWCERTADFNKDHHDDWFPEALYEHMIKTQVWCDLTSLAIPDGEFMVWTKKALAKIAENAEGKDTPITVRMMFGNIIGMPVNCDAVIKELTENLPTNANMRLWVGAWRKRTTWNHAKIIAVDGHHLWTGGHNFWDKHYLKESPVHDLSMVAEGRVAHDGHLFANIQWDFIKKKQKTPIGWVVSQMPDSLPTILPTRVTVSEWPEGVADTFPPTYEKKLVPYVRNMAGHVPIISMGRYGMMEWFKTRSSDTAFVAMFDAAQKCIKLALQDLGPICLPNIPGPVAVPGMKWPDNYMNAIARGIWERDIEVKVALSNPGSIPGGLTPMDALYGNGWTCADVAAEFIKRIKSQFSEATDEQLADKVRRKLHIVYIKEKSMRHWDTGITMGMHAKHFIIDDKCYYIGSQNLYMADLAEWGLFIDHEGQTSQIMKEYWNPMWDNSYAEGRDLDVQEAINGCGVDRNGQTCTCCLDAETKAKMQEAQQQSQKISRHSTFCYKEGK